ETPDAGVLSRAKATTAGYLPQEGLRLSGRTVFDEGMSVFASIQAMETELESLGHKLAELPPDSPEYNEAADRFHQLDSELHARDGYALDAQVGAVLTGLGFATKDWNRPSEEFSGGWQMRIALAKLLLEKPNLLLLDEPTNHLDLEARNWLEDYLASYPNSYVLVSHDRYFLDVTTSRTVEVWNRGVHFYAGNYSKYLEEKTLRRTQLE
ncbi:MAG: ABC-F family ATP-binding cassette domain-containing protein, partial [bacterium]|nr:ABC-F family ATP-binding cassette domain-containing protein [bacterium]